MFCPILLLLIKEFKKLIIIANFINLFMGFYILKNKRICHWFFKASTIGRKANCKSPSCQNLRMTLGKRTFQIIATFPCSIPSIFIGKCRISCSRIQLASPKGTAVIPIIVQKQISKTQPIMDIRITYFLIFLFITHSSFHFLKKSSLLCTQRRLD